MTTDRECVAVLNVSTVAASTLATVAGDWIICRRGTPTDGGYRQTGARRPLSHFRNELMLTPVWPQGVDRCCSAVRIAAHRAESHAAPMGASSGSPLVSLPTKRFDFPRSVPCATGLNPPLGLTYRGKVVTTHDRAGTRSNAFGIHNKSPVSLNRLCFRRMA